MLLALLNMFCTSVPPVAPTTPAPAAAASTDAAVDSPPPDSVSQSVADPLSVCVDCRHDVFVPRRIVKARRPIRTSTVAAFPSVPCCPLTVCPVVQCAVGLPSSHPEFPMFVGVRRIVKAKRPGTATGRTSTSTSATATATGVSTSVCSCSPQVAVGHDDDDDDDFNYSVSTCDSQCDSPCCSPVWTNPAPHDSLGSVFVVVPAYSSPVRRSARVAQSTGDWH